MVVELIFALVALALAVHLGHLLQAVKDGGRDAVVLSVDDFAHVRSGGTVQLTLHAGDVELQGALTLRGQRETGPESVPVIVLGSPGKRERKAQRLFAS